MKAIISNKIYLKLPSVETTKSITDSLTYRITKKGHNGGFMSVEHIRMYAFQNPDVLVLPQGRQDLIPEDYVIEDRRVYNEVPFPTPLISLNEEQDKLLNNIDDSCFLNAKPGWGKTFTALYIARKLGQKTLVITHTVDLRNQWQKEVEKLFGCTAGVIGSSKFEVDDHFIVIANIQSLKKVFDKVNKDFGTIILDEAHHCPATSFMEVMNNSYARYRIALSGTMERLDGRQVLFKDIFGGVVFKPAKHNTMTPSVHVIDTGFAIPKEGSQWVDRMNALMYDPEYQKLTATIAKTYANKGHKVLVVADRVEFLEEVCKYCGEKAILITGAQGDRRDLDNVLVDRYDIVVASRQIFSEGISINILGCVIMPQPSGNPILLEQLTNRVTRQYPGKLDPVIVDMKLKGSSAGKQYRDRLSLYVTEGWKVTKI